MKRGEILVCLDGRGVILWERPYDPARQPQKNGVPVFGPRARRLLTAREVLELLAFRAWCVANDKEPTARQAAKWRKANRAACLVPVQPDGTAAVA
jgi:hypothetical protein